MWKKIVDKLFCAHDWEKINEINIPSEFHNVVSNNYKPTSLNDITRKYISDYQCKKCGKFKRLITKTN